MESEPTSSPPSRKQRGRNAPQRNQNRQKMPQWGLPAEKSFRIVRKRRKGASFQAPHDEQSDTATAKPQVANIINAEFLISSEQHACNEAPLWHFLAETTQQDATQGLNGRSTIRLPDHRRHAHHFTRQTATRADPRTKSQAARATFPRTQALSISTARPRQHSQHFEHQAFPASPTRPQAARRRHTRQAASRIPNSMSTKPPTPCPPNLQCHSHQAFRIFQKKQPHFSM